MGSEREGAVKAFLAECEGTWDSTHVERLLGHFASDAAYNVNSWEPPLVGHDAIRREFLRELPFMTPFRCDLVAIGSAGEVVFTERLDSMIINGTSVTLHIAGIFEVTGDGKIVAWRDYYDPREVEAQVGQAGS